MKEKAQVGMREKALVNRGTEVRIKSLCQQEKDVQEIASLLYLHSETVQKLLDQAEQRSRIVYVFADGAEPATIIDVRNLTRKIEIVNLTDELTSRAFGIKDMMRS